MHTFIHHNMMQAKLMSAKWKELKDRSKYEQQAEDDKVRYNNEMKDYTPPQDEGRDELEDCDASPEEDGARPVKRSRANVDMASRNSARANHAELPAVPTYTLALDGAFMAGPPAVSHSYSSDSAALPALSGITTRAAHSAPRDTSFDEKVTPQHHV